MESGRLLVPMEKLGVMGLGVFSREPKFGVEFLALSGGLQPHHVSKLCGNGMHMAGIGAALLFVLSAEHIIADDAPLADDDTPPAVVW